MNVSSVCTGNAGLLAKKHSRCICTSQFFVASIELINHIVSFQFDTYEFTALCLVAHIIECILKTDVVSS